MSEDTKELWDEHNKLRDKHEALHREHEQLKARYDNVLERFDALDHTIADNERRRAERHDEVLAELRQVSKGLKELRTAEDERAGMAKLGRAVAAVAVFFLTALGIWGWIDNWFNGSNGPSG